MHIIHTRYSPFVLYTGLPKVGYSGTTKEKEKQMGGVSKKGLVDEAVREYIDNHREEINQRVLAALGQLDGTKAAAVSFATGLSRARIDELGGIEE